MTLVTRMAMITAAVLVVASQSAAQDSATGSDIAPFNDIGRRWDRFAFAGHHGHYVRLAYDRKRDIAAIVLLLPGWTKNRRDWQYDASKLASFLVDNGFAVASIEPNWRSSSTPSQDRHLLAQAIGEITRQAARRGYDSRRMVLVGAGVGGRDAAIFGTNPQWLQSEGVEFTFLRAVIILNGLRIDPSNPDYEDDPAFAETLAPPNAPRFLLHSVKTDDARIAEANKLADALRRAGTSVELRSVRRSMDKSEPSMIGGENNPENDHLLRFLKDATARAAH